MTQWLYRLPAHPVLIALSWVLGSYVGIGVNAQAALRPLLVVALLTGALVAVLRLIAGRWDIAGVVATAGVIVLVSPDFGTFWPRAWAVSLVAIAVFVAGRWKGWPIPWPRVTGGLNLLGVLFLAVTIGTGVLNGTVQAGIADLAAMFDESDHGEPSPGSPDIYVVLFDGYPRADILQERLGIDNGPFLDELAERGFTVASESHSAYMYTDLTLLSALHGRHLDDIAELDPLFAGERRPALGRQTLEAAPILDEFRAHGYTIVANEPTWEEPALRSADVLLPGSGLNEFERHLLLSSLPGTIWEETDPGIHQTLHAPWITDAFAHLADGAALEIDGPRLVYTHIPSPHLPIVFTADGGRADARFGRQLPSNIGASPTEVTAAYEGQLEDLNRRLIETLDGLELPDDAVVVVMGDHGAEFGLNWYDGDASDLPMRFATLFASRNADGLFPDDVSASAVMVLLANGVLGTTLPAVEDRFYVSNAFGKLGSLHEVADPLH
jgi:hypothetical protein